VQAGPIISDLSDPAAQRLADVAKPSHNNAKTAVVEDLEPLLHAIAAGVEFIELLADSTRPVPTELLQACQDSGLGLRQIDPALTKRIFKTDKQPKVFGIVRTPRPARLSQLLNRPGDLVVLDGVRIVGNIGAIVRSAAALGAAGVVLVDSQLSTVADRRLLRASRGLVFSLPVVIATADQVATFLQQNQIPAVVLDAHGDTRLYQLSQRPERLALVFGSERSGPSQGLGRLAQVTVSIPMSPLAESLNVSVSVGITLQARAAAQA